MNPVGRGTAFGGRPWIAPDILSDVCQVVFSSLPRRDQRRWAEVYVRGLLTVDGRKSVRRIAAAHTGATGATGEQNLQQFVSKSPWDWKPVRRALADYLQHQIQPQALAVEPLFIPKAGGRSVGVERQFVPHLGRVSNCQQAYGIWMVGQDASYPVDWGLALPSTWTADPGRRRRGGIPDNVVSDSPVHCAVADVLDLPRHRQAVGRPVLMEVGDNDLDHVCSALNDQAVPFILRVGGSFPVAAAGAGSAPFGGQWVSARRVIDSLRGQHRPVEWVDRSSQRRRVAPIAAATVHLPRSASGGTSTHRLLLVGAWTDPAVTRPAEFWLTNTTQQSPAAVFRTAQLTQQVQRDLREVSAQVGVSDFEGRSFRGWHHHATLVSVAHAITLLSQAQESSYSRLGPFHPLPGPAESPSTALLPTGAREH
ncbi:IS701 family transposase [Streptacidiphilus sp. EB129]|uniref:IS701 family transposase n=1 Tax=Streptacidiphilus sp. EB129 TaxID=3156262 RepID=UPI003518666F